MNRIRKLLSQINIDAAALPSNIKYGTKTYKRNGVTIFSETETDVELWVGGLSGGAVQGGGSKRRVHFWIEDGKLSWRCTGNPKDHEIFCKHCVAALLHIKSSQIT